MHQVSAGSSRGTNPSSPHGQLMPPEHAERLAEWFEHTELVWVDDSSTLIPIDRPDALTAHLERFLERYAR